MRKSMFIFGVFLCSLVAGAPQGYWAASAAASELKLSFGAKASSLTAAQLLARPDVTSLTIANDPAYGRSMTYRAVPVLRLLEPLGMSAFDTLEVAATDGYVSQLPMALIARGASGGAVAWLAIEDPKQPWPHMPKKKASPAPFYLVWQSPEKSSITPSQWPYAIGTMTGAKSPMMRWPQMAVADADTPAGRGMHVFIKHCLACHRIDGAGEAEIGPDMARPMSPTEYMTPAGLKALIRDPKSVRTWPKQEMTGFEKDVLPDGQLDDLLAYIGRIAQKRSR